MSFLSRLAHGRRYPVLCAAALFVLLSGAYWLLLASDRYVSEARVVLARSDLSSGQAMDFASLIGGASGGNRPDQLQLRDHLRSIDMLKKLDAQLQLRQHYSSQGDWLSRLWQADAPIETFHSHFQRRVSVELDEFAGVLVISAQAYTPEVAQAISAALLSEGERYMNGLGNALAQEQVKFLEQQVTDLSARVQTTRAALLTYQNTKGLVSPQATAENLAAEAFRILDASYEAGINFYDTAENYPVPPDAKWAGRTEEIFGRWMKTKDRDSIILATKVCGPSHGWIKGSQRAGMTALETGSDIGASIRDPAHYCGVYGHKPTYGLCSIEGHALPVFTGVNGNHVRHRHDDFARHAAKASLELDEVVAQAQRAGGVHAHVEHDLAVLDEFHRHLHRCVHLHRDVGR